uniref:Uncharacterized protein n=1 Tax=Kalanchoe fedtschenkoi TaxID=63787 RepID=A0A7N0TNW1_KALFE
MALNLGCLDLGCISASPKHKAADDDHSGSSGRDGAHSASRSSRKIKSRETSPTSANALHKNSAQIKKHSRRNGSPLGWFPRSKVEPYLKRKIKLLQEIAGMNATLDQTLGDSNPHYTRVKREQMAAREAAVKAMEARKAALVEASWCRILKAARIQDKTAEETLLRAEENATKAFEEATSLGVIMYDMPDCPLKSCEVKLSSINGGGSTTHAVTASFETAFEVDKEVAAAVKTAFRRLATCPSLTENELKDILRKISENPDSCEIGPELSDACSGYEPHTTTEIEPDCRQDQKSQQSDDTQLSVKEVAEQKKIRKKEVAEQKKIRKKEALKEVSMEKLIDVMLERLKCLQEDELASLATIVATCGLSAALAKEENSKQHEALNFARRMSSFGAEIVDGHMNKKQPESELPSLDKFLVKHMTKLEKEVQEAKAKNRDRSMERTEEQPPRTKSHNNECSDAVPDLGSILIKHSSRLEKEIEASKRNHGNSYESIRAKSSGIHYRAGHHKEQDAAAVPSLDKCLVKHMSKLEREVQEAKFNRDNEANAKRSEKENMDSNKYSGVESEDSLDEILMKPVHRLEKEKMQALASDDARVSLPKKQAAHNAADCESLDKILVRHVSRLEKEKMCSRLESDDRVSAKRIENHKQAEMTNVPHRGTSLKLQVDVQFLKCEDFSNSRKIRNLQSEYTEKHQQNNSTFSLFILRPSKKETQAERERPKKLLNFV